MYWKEMFQNGESERIYIRYYNNTYVAVYSRTCFSNIYIHEIP